MHATNRSPVQFPMRSKPFVYLLGAAAAMTLVAGCAATPLPGAAPAATSGAPTPSPTRAPQVDTSDWKSFETFGVGFKYPAEWKVVAKKDCEGCEPAGDPKKNPYAKWNIVDADGIEIAEFSADSADDNSGDATYVRTRLETIKVDSNLATPTVVLFEHSKANKPTKENNLTAALMVDEATLAAERDELPQIAYFHPRKDVSAMLETTNGFAKSLGFKVQDVSLEDAKKMMETDGYRNMVALMLSVKAVGQK
ncbi:hypothetical protein ACFY5D_09135 [Paeniglutamicibacter sp. NPDC012692]|uniref:hypothetical protein n=1 Tax=Paeniglutamicibacter sp. NPDC012692 TaxID=3364388 RepID=UPI0036A86C3C